MAERVVSQRAAGCKQHSADSAAKETGAIGQSHRAVDEVFEGGLDLLAVLVVAVGGATVQQVQQYLLPRLAAVADGALALRPDAGDGVQDEPEPLLVDANLVVGRGRHDRQALLRIARAAMTALAVCSEHW